MARRFKESCLLSVFTGVCIFLFISAFPVLHIILGVVYMPECPAAPLIPVYVMVCGIYALLVMGLFALLKLLCPAALSHILWTVSLLVLVLFSIIWFLFGSYQIYSVYPPNYTRSSSGSNSSSHSVSSPTLPDSSLDLSSQNQSLPHLNNTWMISSNQTLGRLIQTLALSSINNKTDTEQVHAAPTQRLTAAGPYCNRTLYLFAFWTTTLLYVLAANALLIGTCIYGSIKFTDMLSTVLS